MLLEELPCTPIASHTHDLQPACHLKEMVDSAAWPSAASADGFMLAPRTYQAALAITRQSVKATRQVLQGRHGLHAATQKR